MREIGPRKDGRAIFLDFDGVVLESADMKRRAYLRLFQKERDRWPDIDSYHRKNSGIPRVFQIAHIHRHLLGRPLSPTFLRGLVRQYGDLVFHQILRCRLVPGARAFLQAAQLRGPLFLVSGTPEDELHRVVEKRGLKKFFQEVRGASQSKEVILKKLLRRYHLFPSNAVFVGDALSDFAAARANKIPFVARVPRGESSPFPSSVPVVRNLLELKQCLLSEISAPRPALTCRRGSTKGTHGTRTGVQRRERRRR